jgi:hypothetical protein
MPGVEPSSNAESVTPVDGVDPRVDSELAVDGLHVGAHRVDGQVQLAGDLAAREPAGEETQDRALALAQRVNEARSACGRGRRPDPMRVLEDAADVVGNAVVGRVRFEELP